MTLSTRISGSSSAVRTATPPGKGLEGWRAKRLAWRLLVKASGRVRRFLVPRPQWGRLIVSSCLRLRNANKQRDHFPRSVPAPRMPSRPATRVLNAMRYITTRNAVRSLHGTDHIPLFGVSGLAPTEACTPNRVSGRWSRPIACQTLLGSGVRYAPASENQKSTIALAISRRTCAAPFSSAIVPCTLRGCRHTR